MADASEDNTPRHIQNLLKALTEASGRKRKLHGTDMDLYLRAARWFPIGIHPFLSLMAVLQVGPALEFLSAEDLAKESQGKQVLFQAYGKLLGQASQLGKVLSGMVDNQLAYSSFTTALNGAANDARSSDTSSIKWAGLSYVLPNPDTDELVPRIPKASPKAVRGFNHPVLAAAICPLRYKARLSEDGFLDQVKDGGIKILANDWPTFLYPHGTVYDPDEVDKGLFRGETLLTFWLHIFEGPMVAESKGQKKANRPSKAKMHGLTEVTPQTIAYAAVQARMTLSSRETWDDKDGHFDNNKFYNNIVYYFEHDMQDAWCVETLAWWKSKVPRLGLYSATSAGIALAAGEDDDDNIDMDIVIARRAALRRRVRTPTPEASPGPASPGHTPGRRSRSLTPPRATPLGNAELTEPGPSGTRLNRVTSPDTSSTREPSPLTPEPEPAPAPAPPPAPTAPQHAAKPKPKPKPKPKAVAVSKRTTRSG